MSLATSPLPASFGKDRFDCSVERRHDKAAELLQAGVPGVIEPLAADGRDGLLLRRSCGHGSTFPSREEES